MTVLFSFRSDGAGRASGHWDLLVPVIGFSPSESSSMHVVVEGCSSDRSSLGVIDVQDLGSSADDGDGDKRALIHI